MGDFNIGRQKVPDWRGDNLPARPMADQIGDVIEKFDNEKDFRSIAALTQGIRWIDAAHTNDDTLDKREWQAVRRAMQKSLGTTAAPSGDRADRIMRAFADEADSAKTV